MKHMGHMGHMELTLLNAQSGDLFILGSDWIDRIEEIIYRVYFKSPLNIASFEKQEGRCAKNGHTSNGLSVPCTLPSGYEDHIPLADIGIAILQEEQLVHAIFLKSWKLDE